MKVTIKDICKKTDLSTATISRVLNDSPLVNDKTRERVQEALRKYGYQPNHAARSLKLNRTGMIAVLFPELDSGFYTDVLRGIDEMASEFGTHILTAFAHGPEDEQALISRMALERRADALIVMNLTLSEVFLQQVKVWGLPLVLIDRPMKEGDAASVGIDNRRGTLAMTRHLIEQGLHRICFIAGPDQSYDARERKAAFLEVMRERDREVPPATVLSGLFTEESGYSVVKKFLAGKQCLPDAFFAANDAMAIGAYRALRESGLEVPRDVALAGFDDINVARLIGLTTVSVPMRQLGRESARIAADLIDGRTSGGHHMLATQLVVRESTDRKKMNRNNIS